MIRVGTSGFSYRDWIGSFYPESLPDREKLSYYAREFDTVEINFSYYRIPTASSLEALARKVPSGFLFTIKTPQELTHKRDEGQEVAPKFVAALQPWIERDCLGCVLAQFPSSFHYASENVDYLKRLRDWLAPLPIVVEFRHVTWVSGRVFELLRELGLGICCVDQPNLPTLLPPFSVVTSDIAYIRLHGRNASKWWEHDEAWERYNYRYTPQELAPWAQRAREMETKAQMVFIFANNHWKGQAVDTARQMKMLLEMGGAPK